MWMPRDMGCPKTNVEMLTLDWEALGRLVRERTRQMIAMHLASTEDHQEPVASSESQDRVRTSELP